MMFTYIMYDVFGFQIRKAQDHYHNNYNGEI